MQAFSQVEAVAAPLARANIDTDQIVPALYLQKPRSDNFGHYLFHDVRHDALASADPTSCSMPPRTQGPGSSWQATTSAADPRANMQSGPFTTAASAP